MRGKSDNCSSPPPSTLGKVGGGSERREGDARRQLDQWESSDAGPSIPHVPVNQLEAGDAGPQHPTCVGQPIRGGGGRGADSLA